MSIKILSVFAFFLQLSATAPELTFHAIPFTSNTTTSTSAVPGVFDLKAVVVNQKIRLHWKAEENQSVNLFEVEKSLDGRHFTLAALVFGSDKESTEEYLFYEKSTGKKTTYRVKIISKDKQVYYSATVTAG